jgi:hypothetical protein
MCTYGERTFRILDYIGGEFQELVSRRAFATLELARAYRDAKFPGASVWCYVGGDGYLVYEEEDAASWKTETLEK